jgi:tRNA (guanine-N7-)-methyltransferase
VERVATPLFVEIGFARGNFLFRAARARGQARFLGFEVRSNWCLRAVHWAERDGRSNIRILRGDFREFCEDLLAPGSVTAFFVQFPDPWWKKRHHKKRLLGPEFVAAAGRFLIPGGFVAFRTDVEPYFQATRDLFREDPAFIEGPEPSWCAGLPSHRETVCRRLGEPTFSTAFFKKTNNTNNLPGGPPCS